MFWRILAGLFLVAHGLVHLMFLLNIKNDPKWPFNLTKSLILPNVNGDILRILGIILVSISVVAFVTIGIAIIFGLLSAKILTSIIIVSSAISLVLTTIFWANDFWIVTIINLAIICTTLFTNFLNWLIKK